MNIQTTFFKATDGVKLKGIVYKSQSKTQKILIKYFKKFFLVI